MRFQAPKSPLRYTAADENPADLPRAAAVRGAALDRAGSERHGRRMSNAAVERHGDAGRHARLPRDEVVAWRQGKGHVLQDDRPVPDWLPVAPGCRTSGNPPLRLLQPHRLQLHASAPGARAWRTVATSSVPLIPW